MNIPLGLRDAVFSAARQRASGGFPEVVGREALGLCLLVLPVLGPAHRVEQALLGRNDLFQMFTN